MIVFGHVLCKQIRWVIIDYASRIQTFNIFRIQLQTDVFAQHEYIPCKLYVYMCMLYVGSPGL